MVDREVSEEGVDLLFRHLRRVALAVEQDEAADPLPVRLLGPAAHLAGSDRGCEPLEEPGLAMAGNARLRSAHDALQVVVGSPACRGSRIRDGLLPVPRDGIRRLDLAPESFTAVEDRDDGVGFLDTLLWSACRGSLWRFEAA